MIQRAFSGCLILAVFAANAGAESRKKEDNCHKLVSELGALFRERGITDKEGHLSLGGKVQYGKKKADPEDGPRASRCEMQFISKDIHSAEIVAQGLLDDGKKASVLNPTFPVSCDPDDERKVNGLKIQKNRLLAKMKDRDRVWLLDIRKKADGSVESISLIDDASTSSRIDSLMWGSADYAFEPAYKMKCEVDRQRQLASEAEPLH